MQYDIAIKELLRHCSQAILEHLAGLPVQHCTLLEVPQETTSVRRSDFPLRVVTPDGEEFLVLIEVQTFWEPRLPLRLLEYRARHMLREGLEAYTVVLLLRPGGRVTEVYTDREVQYRFRVIPVYAFDAEELLAKGPVCLLPLVPLMQKGEALLEEADKRIYESNLNRLVKGDLLTIMALLAGLVSEDLPRRLLERRRDIMVESAAYKLIWEEALKEGLKEGLQEGLRQGKREGLLEGIALGLELKFGAKGLQVLPDVQEIQDPDLLEVLHRALREVQTLDEFEQLLRAVRERGRHREGT